MKRIIQVAVLAALAFGSQVASSESAIPADGESGLFMQAASTYADGNRGGRDVAGSAIPADGESRVYQEAVWTSADRSAKSEIGGSAIPADGESGAFQAAASTYADRHASTGSAPAQTAALSE